MIWAIILAAGKSERMERAKLLLPFGDKTIIETVIESVLQSNADKVLVVLGSKREKIEQKIKSYVINIGFNPRFAEGMLSSVQHGFQAVPSNARAALVVLGDQPSVSSATINKIIDEFERTKKGIVLPVYESRRGHPILIDMKYRDEIEHLDPEIGLRELVHRHPEDVLEIEVDTPTILQDIDDKDDYEEELKGKGDV
ncbi:MAG: NTP transferase domain-containing protein [Candidatus Latescibacteria bacterium]|nr:NTP transferase domain-containing protein [Candidatus Latescibacterota bacterium]NIM21726.1 NTP transferase domain-containing protein [Candidatus Latescibacterota bacterium]NIM65864.1 NTP transferase domain-containing protein [Candidatus Latescibacterota bacterium]NIO02609.1 NTP transferase domain-containing protein [Candidatus Latescibacterota bacterium]NIO29590.1 NTP transferase domain-containing protein [Candidatus Latescibacterota bacterium]